MALFTVVALVASCMSLASASGYNCPSPFGYYSDANDCAKFIRCAWGKAYSFYCPKGTRWSAVLLTCDHEYNVPCYGYGAAPTASRNTHSYHSYGTDQQGYGASSSYGNFYQGYGADQQGYSAGYGGSKSSGYQSHNTANSYNQPSNYDNYGYSSYSDYSNGNGYGNGYY